MLNLMNIISHGELSPNEISVLSSLEKAISSNNKKNLTNVLEKLQGFTLNIHARFIQHSSILREFCQNNAVAQEIIKNKLQKLGCPNIDIISKDKTESHSILDHCYSHYLMNDFVGSKASITSGSARVNLLKDACQLGSYQGLIIRCKQFASLMSRPTVVQTPEEKPSPSVLTASKKNDIRAQMHADANRLADLYGAIGYIRKGFVLLKLASIDRQSTVEEDKALYASEVEQAIKNFMCAQLLKEDSYSNSLIQSITNGVGLSAIFKQNEAKGDDIKENEAENVIEFTNWEEANILFLERLGKDTYRTLLGEAKSEIAKDLARSQLSDIKVTPANPSAS